MATKTKSTEDGSTALQVVDDEPQGGALDTFSVKPIQAGASALAAISGNVEVTKAMASIYLAKTFPRNLTDVTNTYIASCRRLSFAQKATYAYPRGKEVVTGPSIRLMEMLLAAWGNAEAGWKKLNTHLDENGEFMVSECVAFAFDMQSNIRREIAFSVPHTRDKWEYVDGVKAKIKVALTDDRDVYEICANMASRRVRACMQQIIPAWVVEEAMEAINKTLESGDAKTPLPDLIRRMEAQFKDVGVSKAMLEAHLQHPLGETTRPEIVRLGRTWNAINDGQVRVSDVFTATTPLAQNAARPSFMRDDDPADEIPGLGDDDAAPQFGTVNR